MTECLHRRGFLGLAGAAGIGALVGAASAHASIPAAGGAGGLEFALVSDTHVNASATQRQQWLANVLAAIAARNPAFVLHCGDITDTGVADEYDIYGTLLPASLHGRVHYTPGNHEVRWDGTAEELYHGHFGPAPYSFQAAGIRFIGFDPTQQLQEPGHYSDAHLDWLDRTLHGDAPSFLFQHYPLGDDFYYVDDQDRFLDLARRHSLRGILAGHIHADHVSRFNGLTQVAFDAVRNGPMYYRGHLAGGAIELTRVEVATDGTETTRPAATVPLTGAMGVARPAVIDLGRVSGGAVPVSVRLAGGAAPASVGAVAYPQPVFSGTSASTWTPLTGSGTRWQGSVDVSALVPGGQRVKVRVTGADGGWWEDVRPVELPAIAGTPRVSWQHRLDGAVQGAIAVGADVVVAGSTGGDVAAFAANGRPLWTRRLGSVYRSAAFSADGSTVFVPSADHRVYALDTGTGRTRWSYTAGAPVLSWPLVSTVNGAEQVLVSAGNALISLDPANGSPLWTSDAGGFFAGRVACDGARVYRGGGDGHLRAFDAVTGTQVWDRVLVTGNENHVLLNGPWDVALLLQSGVLLAGTVGGLWGVDPATGAVHWQRSGGYLYPPAIPVPETATALVLTEFGALSLINVADGTSRWDRNLGLRVLNSGGVLRGDAMWLETVDGRLIGLDVATGADLSRLQHTTAYCFATPAVLGNLVVTGDQDGFVRAIQVA